MKLTVSAVTKVVPRAKQKVPLRLNSSKISQSTGNLETKFACALCIEVDACIVSLTTDDGCIKTLFSRLKQN